MEVARMIEMLRDRAMVGRMEVRDKRLMLEAADRLAKIENEAWDAGFNAAITEGGYRKASTVAVETIEDFETRIAVHFGTYTSEEEVKISEVFKAINRIVVEMLEDEK